MEETSPAITVYGAMFLLTARLLFNDEADESGIIKKYYISKEEARRRLKILRELPPDMELPLATV
jgi:hypothetical protein